MYYYHTDHLGTPQALTDEHGALALEMDYQAWARRAKSSPTPPQKPASATRSASRGSIMTTSPGCTTTAIATMIRRSGDLFRGIRLG
ncbi:RHS protein [Chromobacterium violaceum]|uniref:RHS protein n=1 Tax=Chromobacterium violaceum TaxID=536 RepID=A0A447T9G6_CHRVL|nr:RHS protein [Chromobacterium violaceum]